MDTKSVRLSGEHAESYAATCARLIETVLAIVDADVESGRRTFPHEILEEISGRLARMIDELDAIKHQLIELRYAEAIKRALPPLVAEVDDHNFRLSLALEGVVPRAYAFARAARLASVPDVERAEFEFNARVHVELMDRVIQHCEATSWKSEFLFPVLARLRSLHDGISYEQAEELETRRWRD